MSSEERTNVQKTRSDPLLQCPEGVRFLTWAFGKRARGQLPKETVTRVAKRRQVNGRNRLSWWLPTTFPDRIDEPAVLA